MAGHPAFVLTASLSADSRPNVLFIAVDDMNDWVGCMDPATVARTPHIDRLASRGLCFTHAHAAGVFCAPSRAAVFSGQFGSTTGCYRSATYFVDHPEIVSLQTSFDRAGYKTLGVGKLYHHMAGGIDTRGWDHFLMRKSLGTAGLIFLYDIGYSSSVYQRNPNPAKCDQ